MNDTQTISFDMDDTLNWMSQQLAIAAGTDIPKFDDIKAGNAAPEFYQARNRLFADPEFWASQPKSKHANDMIAMAHADGFKPIICTKTPTSIPGMNLVAAAKVKWQQDMFPGVDMLIATGTKHADSTALVDDGFNNCVAFNQYSEWYRPVLVWDNSRPDLDALQAMLNMSRHHDIAHKYEADPRHASCVVVKAKDTGRIAVAIRDNEVGLPAGVLGEFESSIQAGVRGLYDETGISVPTGLTKTFVFKQLENVIHCYYVEVETELDYEHPHWMSKSEFLATNTHYYRDMNAVLLYNLGL